MPNATIQTSNRRMASSVHEDGCCNRNRAATCQRPRHETMASKPQATAMQSPVNPRSKWRMKFFMDQIFGAACPWHTYANGAAV